MSQTSISIDAADTSTYEIIIPRVYSRESTFWSINNLRFYPSSRFPTFSLLYVLSLSLSQHHPRGDPAIEKNSGNTRRWRDARFLSFLELSSRVCRFQELGYHVHVRP